MTALVVPLPYGRQTIEGDDVAAVAEALQSGWLTGGPAVERLELAFAETVGVNHAVASASGTAALHLACIALNLQAHDAVIVPAITFVATANAPRYTGAEVVFADVDAETGLMRPEHLEAAIAQARMLGLRLRAVFPVHLAGQVCDLPALRAIAEREGLAVVEDACHAVGSRYRTGNGDEAAVGSCEDSRLTVFSLHPVKTITMGEGGIVTTNDATLAAVIRRYRNHAANRDAGCFADHQLADDGQGGTNPWYHEFPDLGFNYRASDLHCALGLSQLCKLPRFVAARAALVEAYHAALAPLAPIVRPMPRVAGCRPCWHLLVTLIDFAAAGVPRAAVMRSLAEAGIGTQVHYIPVHFQPYYRRRYGLLDLPGAAAYYDRCLSLPLFPTMTTSDVRRVVAALADALAGGAGCCDEAGEVAA